MIRDIEEHRILEEMYYEQIAMDFDLEQWQYERSMRDINNVLDSLDIGEL